MHTVNHDNILHASVSDAAVIGEPFVFRLAVPAIALALALASGWYLCLLRQAKTLALNSNESADPGLRFLNPNDAPSDWHRASGQMPARTPAWRPRIALREAARGFRW